MKWDTDDYKYEKWKIFDILKDGLAHCHAKHCTVHKAMFAIDDLFNKITELEDTE